MYKSETLVLSKEVSSVTIRSDHSIAATARNNVYTLQSKFRQGPAAIVFEPLQRQQNARRIVY
jgi:hypothetical protein